MLSTPLSASPEVDVEVRREDQALINEFGRLNARKHDARDEVAEAKKRAEELDDAEEGVMLADAEPGTVKCVAAVGAAGRGGGRGFAGCSGGEHTEALTPPRLGRPRFATPIMLPAGS